MPFWGPPYRLLVPGAYLPTSGLAAAVCPNQTIQTAAWEAYPTLQPDHSHCARHSLAANQARGQPCLPDHPQYSSHHNKRGHTAHTGGTPKGGTPRAYSSEQEGSELLGPTGCQLHKATSPRSRNLTNLPDTQKYIQKIGQNDKKAKYVLNKGTRENLRKRTK